MTPCAESPQPLLVRHELDTAVVAAQLAKKLAEFERLRARLKVRALQACEDYAKDVEAGKSGRWVNPPQDPRFVDMFTEQLVAAERERCATVRVIEHPTTPASFLLVYGFSSDAATKTGTGPFKSLDEAVAWFADGGR